MYKSPNQSWLELLDSSGSDKSFNQSISPPKLKIQSVIEEEEETRRFEIEIIDKKNEEKFDKLIHEKKIKSPFKRRLSNDMLSSENISSKRIIGEEEEVVSSDENDEIKDEDQKQKSNPRKKFRSDRSSESSSNCSSSGTQPQRELETDKATLDRRQKQIDYGKNTIGYSNYIRDVPKHSRTNTHPKTPPKHLKYSRRAWEGLVKSWRKKLHQYDDTCDDNKN